MSKYATTAGIPTRGDAYSKLIYHLEEAADQAAVLSHIHNTEDVPVDKLYAASWLKVHEGLLTFRNNVINLAKNKSQ